MSEIGRGGKGGFSRAFGATAAAAVVVVVVVVGGGGGGGGGGIDDWCTDCGFFKATHERAN